MNMFALGQTCADGLEKNFKLLRKWNNKENNKSVAGAKVPAQPEMIKRSKNTAVGTVASCGKRGEM